MHTSSSDAVRTIIGANNVSADVLASKRHWLLLLLLDGDYTVVLYTTLPSYTAKSKLAR